VCGFSFPSRFWAPAGTTQKHGEAFYCLPKGLCVSGLKKCVLSFEVLRNKQQEELRNQKQKPQSTSADFSAPPQKKAIIHYLLQIPAVYSCFTWYLLFITYLLIAYRHTPPPSFCFLRRPSLNGKCHIYMPDASTCYYSLATPLWRPARALLLAAWTAGGVSASAPSGPSIMSPITQAQLHCIMAFRPP
jgi:hypothetical protein